MSFAARHDGSAPRGVSEGILGGAPRRGIERDIELGRLERELRESRHREQAARAEVRQAHERFEQLRSTSKNFAVSMRESSAERRRSRRRISAQYAVGRVLAEAGEVEEAAESMLRILVGDLGWTLGTFWSLRGDVLRCHDLWPRSGGERAFEEACRGLNLRRGEGLPGRAWAAGRPVWVEDVLADEGFLRRSAAEESGLRAAVAFPVCDGGRTSGVFELFWEEVAPRDEELLRVASAIGGQIGQFAERRRAEKERERLLHRERAAHAEAEAARGRVAEILESITDNFYALDADFRFTYVNAQAEAYLGIPKGRMLGRAYTEVLPKTSGHEILRRQQEAMAEGKTVRFETRSPITGKWVDLSVFPAGDGLTVYFRDVTGRRQVQEALRENAEWLRLAQRAAGSGTWEWDLRNGEIRWSAEHRDLFGFEPSEEPITREEWWGAIHPEDLPRIEEAGRRCSEEGEEWPEVTYRISRDGETRWIIARGQTVMDEKGWAARILGTSVDITERRRAEEERDRLRAREWVARAEVAERERISRELHDRVAHSMAVVHQSLQLHEFLKDTKPSQAAAKMELAREMAKTALEYTRNLSMELRRSEAEEGLVPALEDLLKVAVPPGVRAELCADGDESHVPPRVRGQLFSILREGVRNAVRHSGANNVRVDLGITPEAAVCGVVDDGRGLPQEKIGDGSDDGNAAAGVGLRSMRERAGLLGGEFRLSSSLGGGTRVEVKVPLDGGG